MPDLLPFRSYDEHDVINLFAYDYSGTDVKKGTFVSIKSGWTAQENVYDVFVNGATYGNTVNPRYGIGPKVTTANSGDSKVIGMMLYDVRELDENGEKLLYNSSKAAEMQTTISGQAVPIVTRGVFLYSGVTSNTSVAAGDKLYIGAGGVPTNERPLNPDVSGYIGRALGPTDPNGWCLIKIDL